MTAPIASKARMGGFSIVAAIFILVVLAALGAFMVTIGAAQSWTTAGAEQSARTYHAAEAGIEWGIAQAIATSTCTGTFALSGFTVTVNCTTTNFTEAGASFNVYAITSTAVTTGTTLGNPNHFSRTLQITVTNAT